MALSASTVVLNELYRLANADPRLALSRLSDLEPIFEEDIHFAAFRPGVIINAGMALSDIERVQEGVDALKAIVELNDSRIDEWRSSLLYNLANGYFELSLEYRRLSRDPGVPYLQEAKRGYRRALEVDGTNDSAVRVQILVNYGNALSACGRHYEALLTYDDALKLDPTYSMALGNKGIELARYAHLARNQSGLLLAEAYELCNAAAADKYLDEQGLASARAVFMEYRDSLSSNYTDYKDKLNEVRNRNHPTEKMTREEEFHHLFAVEHHLYLNLCVHDWRCSEQNFDTLFFSYVTPIEDIDIFPKLARYFNQAKEDFATARYLLSSSMMVTPRRKRISDRTTYADLLEYADYGLTGGLAKTAYAAAYNILDKIAVFLKWDLQLPETETAVDFKKVWCERGKSALRSEISDVDDPSLFALYDLSLDLRDPDFERWTSIRHSITHRQLVVHDWLLMVGEGSADSEHVLFSELVRRTINLLRLVKSALVYLAAYLNRDQERKASSATGLIPPLPIVWQHEIQGR